MLVLLKSEMVWTFLRVCSAGFSVFSDTSPLGNTSLIEEKEMFLKIVSKILLDFYVSFHMGFQELKNKLKRFFKRSLKIKKS